MSCGAFNEVFNSENPEKFHIGLKSYISIYGQDILCGTLGLFFQILTKYRTHALKDVQFIIGAKLKSY